MSHTAMFSAVPCGFVCNCDSKLGLKMGSLKGCKSFYFLVLFVAAILKEFLSGFIKDFIAS